MLNKKEYLDSVCNEIRFRAAREYLREELSAHIDDKAEGLKKQGAPDPEAAAVAAMGSAEETGRALNKAHRPRIEWGVIACVLALSIAGSIIITLFNSDDIYFVSGAWSLGLQIKTVIIGFCLMIAAYYFNYALLTRLRYVLYVAALVLIGYNIIISWYGDTLLRQEYTFPFIDFFALQTPVVVFTTFLFMLSIFGFIDKSRNKGIKGLLPVVGLCAASIAAMTLILASFYAMLLAVVYIVALGVLVFKTQHKISLRLLCLIITAFIFAAVLIVLIKSGSNLLNPRYDFGFGIGIGTDYNAYAVPEMLKESQFIGSSPSYINAQSAALSASGTDFILTSIIARYGWLAGSGFIIVYVGLLLIMFFRSLHIRHSTGRITAIGISAFMLLRFSAFLFTNVGIISDMSCGLPFVSYGGYDYLFCSLLIGIFLSVWRRSSFMKNSAIPPNLLSGAEKI
jgi:cell division protein FtsW (lipid II flippase)